MVIYLTAIKRYENAYRINNYSTRLDKYKSFSVCGREYGRVYSISSIKCAHRSAINSAGFAPAETHMHTGNIPLTISKLLFISRTA